MRWPIRPACRHHLRATLRSGDPVALSRLLLRPLAAPWLPVLFLAAGGPELPAQTAPTPRTVAAETLVVVDPGHGGSDLGARGSSGGLLEKTLAMDLSLRLGRLLENEPGVAVLYTRNSDMSLEQARRSEIANSADGTLLISLHAGFSPNPDLSGARVYFFGESPLPLAGAVDRNAAGRDRPSKAPASSTPSLILWDQAQSSHEASSNDLASSLQSELNVLYDTRLQVSAFPLYLLRHLTMPAALVEVGHLSHPEDEKKLASDEFLERLARALRSGILNYLALKQRLEHSES